MEILGRLPALRRLLISGTQQTQRLLLVSADGFRCVIVFTLYLYSSGLIMFQRGALPRAEQVRFDFGVRMAKDDGNGDFDFGLQGNLLSLRYVFVVIYPDGATDGEAKQAEAALRHAIHVHPNHPRIQIESRSDLLESEEDNGPHGEDEYGEDDDHSGDSRLSLPNSATPAQPVGSDPAQ